MPPGRPGGAVPVIPAGELAGAGCAARRTGEAAWPRHVRYGRAALHLAGGAGWGLRHPHAGRYPARHLSRVAGVGAGSIADAAGGLSWQDRRAAFPFDLHHRPWLCRRQCRAGAAGDRPAWRTFAGRGAAPYSPDPRWRRHRNRSPHGGDRRCRCAASPRAPRCRHGGAACSSGRHGGAGHRRMSNGAHDRLVGGVEIAVRTR